MKIEITDQDGPEVKQAKQALLDLKADTLEQAKKEFAAKGEITDFKSAEVQDIIAQRAQEAIKAFQINDGTKDVNLLEFVKEVEKDVFEMQAKIKAGAMKTDPKTLVDEIKDKREDINKLLKGQVSAIELKADTLRANVTENFYALDIPGIGQLAHRQISLYDTFPKFPVAPNQNGTFRYVDWDSANSVRGAAAIAEAGAYPESTAKWVTYSDTIKKVGDTIPMSSEFLYDDAVFAAELQSFLDTNVKLVIDTALYSGAGTGSTIKGMTTQMPTFTPVAGTIDTPTIYDLIPKVIESIVVDYGSKYTPNVVYMNRATINQYKLTKDNYGQYLIPPFVSRDGKMIDGCLVIESNAIANNKMFVGDSRFARIYEQPGIIVERGMIDQDFTNDLIRLKVSRRLNFLVRTVDQTGWKYVTDINSALVVIGASS